MDPPLCRAIKEDKTPDTKKEEVGEGAIRKNSTQAETAAKPKPAEQKDNRRREEQGKIGEEINIKTRNTFSVLQEEKREPIPRRRLPPQ